MVLARRVLIGLSLACAMIQLTAAEPVLLVVDAAGPTGGDGSPNRPLATVEAALAKVRQLRQSGNLGPIRLQMTGVFRLTKGLRLGAPDMAGGLVLDGQGRTTFEGGRSLDASLLQRVTDKAFLDRLSDQLVRDRACQLDLAAAKLGDLGVSSRRGYGGVDERQPAPVWPWLDGRRLHLARWPNPDEAFPQLLKPFNRGRTGVVSRAKTVDAGPNRQSPDFRTRGPGLGLAFDRPNRWADIASVWVDGIFNEAWEWSFNRAAAWNSTTKTLTLAQGEFNAVADKYSGDFFFFENIPEELDQADEYWIDRAKGLLYLILAPGAKPRILNLATLTDPLLTIDGGQNLTLRGLSFRLGRDLAIREKGSQGTRIETCAFEAFVRGGVELAGTGAMVERCDFRDLGGTALSLLGGDTLTLRGGGSMVSDSRFVGNAWYNRAYTPAIQLTGVGHRVVHCTISDQPHVGIHVTGNDHLIEGCDIGQVCQEFTDMGGIYIYNALQPWQRGTVIRGNYIHDIGLTFPMQNGVYPDNGTMGVTIEDNVFVRIGNATLGSTLAGRAINNNAGAYILARRNLFLDCALPYLMSKHSGGANFPNQKPVWADWFAKHSLANLPHAQRYPELAHFWEEERQYPTTNTWESNLIWNPTRPLAAETLKAGQASRYVATQDGAYEEYKGLTRSVNWTADRDPGFEAPDRGDWRLKPEGPAFQAMAALRGRDRLGFGVRSAPGPQSN